MLEAYPLASDLRKLTVGGAGDLRF
jgi:hypothetical protein